MTSGLNHIKYPSTLFPYVRSVVFRLFLVQGRGWGGAILPFMDTPILIYNLLIYIDIHLSPSWTHRVGKAYMYVLETPNFILVSKSNQAPGDCSDLAVDITAINQKDNLRKTPTFFSGSFSARFLLYFSCFLLFCRISL